MASRNNPIALVQNPAFGAQLLCKFVRGFIAESETLPPMQSLFIVLPILLHERTLEEVRSTYLSSGLTKVVSKLAKERERIVAIHDRALRMRELTLQSISMGVAAGLLQVDYKSGEVWSHGYKLPASPDRLKIHVAGADKLGRWFSRLPQSQVFALLQVAL